MANMEAATCGSMVPMPKPFTSIFLGPPAPVAHLEDVQADFVLSSGLSREIEYTTIDLDSNLNLSCTDVKMPVCIVKTIFLIAPTFGAQRWGLQTD